MSKCKIIKEGHTVIHNGQSSGLGDTVNINTVDAFGREKNWLEEIGNTTKKVNAKVDDK